MISTVSVDTIPQKDMVKTTKEGSSDFSSILDIISTDSSNMAQKVDNSQKTDSSINSKNEISLKGKNLSDDKNFQDSVKKLEKKLSQIKSKIENKEKISDEDLNEISEELEKISSLISDEIKIDDKDLINLLASVSDILSSVLNNFLPINKKDFGLEILAKTEEVQGKIIYENKIIPEDSQEEASDFMTKIKNLLEALESKNTEKNEVVEEAENEDVTEILAQLKEISENLSNLKNQLQSSTEENNQQNKDLEKLTQKVESLLESLVSVIETKEGVTNSTNSINSNAENIDLAEIVTELEVLINKEKLSKEEPNLLKKVDEIISKILDKSQVDEKSLSLQELKQIVQKLEEINKELKSTLETPQKNNPQTKEAKIEEFISQIDKLVGKISTHYNGEQNKKVKNAKNSEEPIVNNLKNNDIKNFTTQITKETSIKMENISSADDKEKSVLKVEKNTITSNEKTVRIEEIVKFVDIKIEVGEKQNIPKFIESRFSDSAKRAEIFDQVEKAMKNSLSSLKNGEIKKMTINLNPKVLGSVVVDVEMKNNDISVKFRVDNDVVKEIFSESTSRLKDVLSSIGINIVDVNIDLNGKNQSGFKQANEKYSNQNRGDQNEEEGKEEPRDEKRYSDSEYEVVI